MSGVNAAAAKSSSTSSFVTALVLNGVIFSIEILAFTILRPRFKAVYEPRTITPVKSQRVADMPKGLFAWPMAIIKADYRDIQGVNGLDAYFFVRFLRMMCIVFLPIWFLSWVILFPVDAVHTAVANKSGLDVFTFGNISANRTDRYWAHLLLAWVFTVWIWWNIKREMTHFITTRQHHLISPEHAASTQASTILITGIPTKYLSEKALLQMYDPLPGGVKKIWINRDLKELPKLYARRDKALNKLESAENALLKTAAQLRLKKLKADKKNGTSTTPTEGPTHDAEGRPLTQTSLDDPEGHATLADRLVPKEERPSHRLPAGFMPFALPFIGQKVDSIEWSRNEVALTNDLLNKGRARIGVEPAAAAAAAAAAGPAPGRTSEDDSIPETKAEGKPPKNITAATDLSSHYPALNSAFITFHQQIAAHIAKNALAHHEPYRMTGRHAEMSPDDVIWGNLGLNAYEAKVRMLISYGATAALILLWAIPVAIVGIISNIHALATTYKWLSWLNSLPSPVTGIIQGILPPVLLAVLMMLLPIILRMLARFEGIPKYTGLELSLMTRFFMFQVIHSFLIVTISSGIIAALPGIIKNPSSVASLLAHNLPAASTFFITYILLQGLSGTAGGFLQLVTLILYYVKLIILGSTPRSIYGLKYGSRTVAWGTLFPAITLVMVIGLAYSVIAPVINGFVFACFVLFFFLYKYLFLWVFEMPKTTDTGGLFFPKAMSHIFVGLYVMQVCLAALFFLTQDNNKKQSAVAQGGLMVVLIIFTIFFQMMISDSYGPLLHSLPLSLADRVGLAPAGSAESRATTEDEKRRLALANDPEAHDAAGVSKGKQIHGTNGDHNGEEEDEAEMKESREPDYGFAMPAATRPQRTIWLAKDTLGLTAEEVTGLQDRGIAVSTQDATMNEKGKVEIQGPPPAV